MNIYLCHTNKEFCQYDKIFTDGTIDNQGSPFTEPLQIYSNINGGLGVFAGYNQYKLRVFP